MTATIPTKFIRVPTHIVEKHERQEQKARLRRARYEDTHHRSSHSSSKRGHHIDAPFVAWDGEGPYDAGYALFGNSEGYEICHPYLGTEECLDLILETEEAIPDAIHIAFGFNYDVSNILKDLPWRHLTALHHYTRTVWKDYELEHIPHKWFKVKRGNTTAKIYDIRSFFAGDYVSALVEFNVGTWYERVRILAGKASRSDFVWADIDAIKEYWQLELRVMPELAEKLRVVFRDAGYVPRSWHGPGALARMALSRHKIYDAMAEALVDVRIASQFAFAGGRFELFRAGHVQGRIYVADINSAYPYFATMLPNLSRGKWRHVRSYEKAHFAVWHIRYESKPDSFRAYPLFRRLANHTVVWPFKTEGWYWQPEANLVANDPDATFIEGWIFDEDDPADRPFAFLGEYYARRKLLKGLGNPAEYTFKLIINAIYGQLAQRAGWDRKNNRSPRSHQLEWAGFITSACRAAVYTVAHELSDKLVSIDTDGVSSLAPIGNVDAGSQLGQWELTDYPDGIYWQSGIYTLKKELGYDPSYDEWTKAKSRGIPKGSYTATDLLACLHDHTSLSLAKKVFITYGLADNGQHDQFNHWINEPHTYKLGGDGKRFHHERSCRLVCGKGLHRLSMPAAMYAFGDSSSLRHHLPWLDGPDPIKNKMDDLTLFDANHLDPEDEWVLEYGTS